MPTPQRRVDAGLIGELLEEPHRFEFFQAVRLIELAQEQSGGGGLDGVRFRNRLSLAFPPSQIENISSDEQGIRITPAFMGMLGSQGALPLHYSERINRHEKGSSDGGPRAFLDIFSHRALTMFYQAWARHRPECMATGEGGDEFMAMLTALAGMPGGDGDDGGEGDGDSGDETLARETLAFYAMQIRSRAVSAPLMAGLYAEYFEVPFAVEQLVGGWQQLPGRDQAQLGKANVDLDAGVLLGARIYACDARVRLRIGPLDRESYERFLPGRGAALHLEALLKLQCGVGLTYQVYLIQRAEDVRGFSLDTAGGARLAVDACLYSVPPECDREELMYLLHT
jgi:type VI secretion system protein ImpH